MTQQPRDYSEIAIIVEATLKPLIEKLGGVDNKIDRLELKVNHLSEDRVTRADVEKLRNELQANLVPRDSYEARHAALIQRSTDTESRLRKHEDDAQAALQHIHERLESGKQQIEDRIRDHEKKTEEKFKEQQNTQLSDKDRQWLRLNQFFGVLAVVIAIVGLIMDHVRIQ
jgi:DNA anti-recombination protein RmuC